MNCAKCKQPILNATCACFWGPTITPRLEAERPDGAELGAADHRLVRLPNVALTIKQPWASLIIMGRKDIENRSWPTKFRGSVLIHASKKKDSDELHSFMDLREARNIPPIETSMTWGDCPAGGVIGVADIVGCVDRSDSPWFVGDWGFVIANARPLPFFACRGALGFWKCEYPAALLSETNVRMSEGADK